MKQTFRPSKLLMFFLVASAIFSGCGSSNDFVLTNPGVTLADVQVRPQGQTIEVGQSVDFDVVGILSNGQEITEEQALQQGFVFTVSWQASGSAATIDADTGVATGVQAGTSTITATVSSTIGSVSPTTTLTVTTPTPPNPNATEIDITPATQTLPEGNFVFNFSVTGTNGGNPVPVDAADISSVSDDTSLVTTNGLTVTTNNTGDTGTATITFTYDDGDPNTPNPTDTATVTVVDETVDSIVVSPDDFTGTNELYVSERRDVTVTGTLTNGATVPLIVNEDLTPDMDFVSFLDGQMVALFETGSPTPSTQTLTITYSGPAANPTNPTDTIDVSVRLAQLVSTQVTIAGIAPGEAGYGVLPVDEWATVEIIGTFEGGGSRPLGFGDAYTITFGGTDGADFDVDTVNERVNAAIINDDGDEDSEATLIIDYADDRDGETDTEAIPLTSVAWNDVRVTSFDFANYQDVNDDRLIYAGGDPVYRTVDVRVVFSNDENDVLSNYRPIGGTLSFQSAANGLTSTSSLLRWPMVAMTSSQVNPFTIRVTHFGDDGSDGGLDLSGVTTVDPIYFSVEQSSVVGEVDTPPGQTATFRTLVDYNDGLGPVERTFDYTVLEQNLDFIEGVFVTIDPVTAAVSFFVKTVNDEDFTVVGTDLRFNYPNGTIPAEGTDSSSTGVINVDP